MGCLVATRISLDRLALARRRNQLLNCDKVPSLDRRAKWRVPAQSLSPPYRRHTSAHEGHQKYHGQQANRHAQDDQGRRVGAFEFLDAFGKISRKFVCHGVVSPCKTVYQPIHPFTEYDKWMSSIYIYWCRTASVVSTMTAQSRNVQPGSALCTHSDTAMSNP